MDGEKISNLFGKEVVVSGIVTTDPVQTRPKVIGSRRFGEQTTYLIRAEKISATDREKIEIKVRAPIRVITTDELSFIPGERIVLSGELVSSKERKVAALLLGTKNGAHSSGRPAIQAKLEILRVQLREAAHQIGGDSASLLPGMVIGDTSLQTPEFSARMVNSGLSHLTAVSGANFAIISAFIFTLVGLILPKRKLQVLITVAIICFYVILARPTPSVVRAATMVAIYLMAKLNGLRTIAVGTLAFAVSLILLINPFLAFEPGFILSVLATCGLIFLAPRIARSLPMPSYLSELVAIPISATIFCAPYILLLSGRINLGTILLNILAAPAIPFITIVTFIALIVIIPLNSLALFLLRLANLGTGWIVTISSFSERFPSLWTSPITIILIGLVTFLVKTLALKGLGLKSVLPIILVLIIPLSSQRILFPGGDWRIGQCDVGQGDALLLNLGNRSAILFDAGPDSVSLKRCLDLFGVKKLPLVIISHRHADHYAGLFGPKGIEQQGVEIGEVWSNASEIPNYSGTILEIRAGISARVGDAELTIIWPRSGSEEFESISGDGSEENNRSLVALVEMDGKRLLVTGDIEPGAQDEILDELPDLDLIKVPHHGSRFQNLELFERAEIFIVSVGPNSYGHPDDGLISHLAGLGRVFRTDKDGTLAITWEPSEPQAIFSVRRLGKEWWRIAWH